MTMGLRKFDELNWLTIDEQYGPQHRLRADLLQESKDKVLQCLPGSEAACVETLELVVDFLIRKYPDDFELPGAVFVRNKRTGEEYRIVAPYTVPPLEVAARLAMDDFNLLIKGEDELHHL